MKYYLIYAISVFSLVISCSKTKTKIPNEISIKKKVSHQSEILNHTFDFREIKTLESLGVYKIDKLTKNKIVFSDTEGFVGDSVLYDLKVEGFHYEGIYKVNINSNNETSYFKFSKQYFSDNRTVFKNNLRWLKNPPKKNLSNKELEFFRVEIPFVNNGDIKFCSIGDSQTWYREGQELRKKIANQLENLMFLGRRQDTYGFPHEGEGGNNTKQVLKRVNDMPKSDIYSLFIGTNDWKSGANKTTSNIFKIISELKKINSQAEIFITTIPKSNDEFRKEKGRTEANMEVNKLLYKAKDSLEKKNIYLIDFHNKVKNKSYSDFLLNDGLHLNKSGYNIYVDLLSNVIKNKSVYYKH